MFATYYLLFYFVSAVDVPSCNCGPGIPCDPITGACLGPSKGRTAEMLQQLLFQNILRVVKIHTIA